MELRDIIQAGLDRVKEETMRVLDGLTPYEIWWRPGPGANSIGLILFHSARSEDMYVQTRIQGKPAMWESEKWYQKLHLPESERGAGFTSAEQVAAFPALEFKDLMAYAIAVRTRTLDYVKGMAPDGFNKIINVPRRGDIAIGSYLVLMMVHMAQHAGEISYLRGLQRGMNK